ncbi:MAG: transporter substrate-binding domain-containing protein [Desulfobacterales bacterium]|nr:transporter substrate-binding domain-containing protein [Desulfobacterales bacterium]
MQKKLNFSIITTWIIVTVTVAVLIFAGTAVADILDIGSMYKPPISNAKGTGLIDLITKERFSRIGVKVEINLVASGHALKKANKGLYDADIMRVGGASEKYTNLIQVPGKIYDFDFVAFTKTVKAPMTGWDSLTPFRVAVPKGWVETDNHVSQNNTTTLVRSPSPFKLFKTLTDGETDLIIYERLMGYQMLKDLDLKDVHVIEPPLSSKDMFLYLHNKHKDLVPKLVQALKDMKEDGTFKKFYDQALRGVK